MSITPYPPLFTERASVLHGSVLDANYPAKWVSFGCKSTAKQQKIPHPQCLNLVGDYTLTWQTLRSVSWPGA